MDVLQNQTVVFYDGKCLLCSRAVQFLIKADKKMVFKFAPQQSDYFNLLSSEHPHIPQTSIIFLKNGKMYSRSTAVLKIIKELSYPWKIIYAAIIIPKFIRNAVYMMIARNRKNWFGEAEVCYLGDEKNKKRFLS